MAEIINPHDKFFKEMLAQPEAARTFLRDFLPPAVAMQIDLSRLQLVKDSFVDEALQEHFSDLVYEVALRDYGSAFVCVLFEHKSYVDSMTPLQVLRYMVHGWGVQSAPAQPTVAGDPCGDLPRRRTLDSGDEFSGIV